MRKYVATIAISLAIVSVTLFGATTTEGKTSDTYKQLNLFGDVFEKIRAQYVREVTDEELIEAAIKGMLVSLDPHSSYLTPKNFDDMQVQTKGEYGGLGMEVTLDKGVVRVVSPIDDTPASRAGIQAGDYITKLDGEQVMGLTLNEAVTRMKGEVGTDIVITVVREGEERPLEITLTRATISIKSVRHRLEGEVGYIRISSFTEKTETGLLEALEKINQELGDDLQGVVLDLRNNPGGLLTQSIAVSSAFLTRGEVVSTRTRNDEHVQRYPARKGDMIGGKPLIVLINGGSASASEIVAGALQDHRRAVVVGTQSFGKGSVQTVIPLGANGAMRLTTAYYFTPSGNSIQGEGITPDVLIEQIRFDKTKEINSRRRSENDLRGRLANPNGTEKQKKDEKNDSKEKDGKKEDQKISEKPEDKEPTLTTAQDDYQLNFAINLLHGMSIARNVD
ncbi:Carboxyl-terminal protease [hydrothermal vent metagenome]|uniref:Carboxyl-terminal protease n=1 Tax=hydrothermal vent metagenome TaxID=652676 RepID=A0A3B0RU04_9ZZZZ